MSEDELPGDDPDLGGSFTEEEIAALPAQSLTWIPEGALHEMRALEESALAEDAAWVLEHYRVAPDGDPLVGTERGWHLRFEGYAPGDFARVSVPVPGEATLVWRSSLACLPDAAFAVAAAEWARARKGAGDE